MTLPPIAVILALALVYGYLNGQHGSASIVATMISSRAIGPRQALLLAALGMSAGPFLLGIAVAGTIGADLISPEARTAHVVIAALVSAIAWSALTLFLKIPSSISQALIGGLIGAAWAGFGGDAVLMPGLSKTLLGLFLSPILGLFAGFGLVRISYTVSASATPHANVWFKRGQVLVSLLMAMAFGANDGQKIMGVVVLGLVATGFMSHFTVPLWVVAFSALGIGIGTLLGGWRLIHTLGGKFYKIRAIHGFGAQLASSIVILGAGLLGGPVSGSQVVTSAIVGAGSADRIQKVRWSVARQIALSWILTLPFSALVAALVYHLTERLFA
jgi:inorganic phosphate transporter, PiT family